jgi:chromosome segregation ATPase
MAPLLQQQSEYNYSIVRELQILNQSIQSLQMQIHQISQEQERYQHVNAAAQQAVVAEQQFLRNLIAELQGLRTPIADLQALTHHLTIYTQQLQAEQQNLRQLSDEVSERLTATDQDLASILHDLSNVTYTLIRVDEHTSGSNMSSN